MKKIDLHIHTSPTISDSVFEFSLDEFSRYVRDASLDAVAVTNHNIFEKDQYLEIARTLDAIVFPGIEINLEMGHALVIADPEMVDEFEELCRLVTAEISDAKDQIFFSKFVEIFGDLNRYLIIPHYDKKPAISGGILQSLDPYITAGEVDSEKKFVRAIRDDEKLTPVLFSDTRIRLELGRLPTRQTYVDCGDISIASLKECLRDKSKVALSAEDGNQLFQLFDDGQKLSTGLNILLGERSSGKTYTLNRIEKENPNVKYIKQFSLVQTDEESYTRSFDEHVQKRRSSHADSYLSGLKGVLDDVMEIDIFANDKAVGDYVETLLKSAQEADRRDSFSGASLFDEVDFPIQSRETLNALIKSVRQVIENIEFRDIIEKHVDLGAMKRLACELIELLWNQTFEAKKMQFVNRMVGDIKSALQVRTSATHVEDVDLYNIALDQRRVDRFEEIVKGMQTESVISREDVQGFSIEVRKGPFSGAGEIKKVSGVQTAFSGAFGKYSEPYEYLQQLLANESLSRAELYKLFARISYRILNRDGFEVSGGERSEFRLLQEIKDSQIFDILLIDEPESSFDNIFLNGNVNRLIKEISRTMPVVVVTHNSTVGASIGADYLLIARKERDGSDVHHKLYSGHPTDQKLFATDGSEIDNLENILNSLEAGRDAYENRKNTYEAIED